MVIAMCMFQQVESTKSSSGSIDSRNSLQNGDSVTKKLSVDRLSGTGSSVSGNSSSDILNFAFARPTVSHCISM